MDAPQKAPLPSNADMKEQRALEIRAAERAHDSETAFGKAANDHAVKAGEEVVKAVILINGGSCVAMLAFIGTLASKELLAPSQIEEITAPLFSFGIGLLLAVIGGSAAYFTNLMIAGSSNRKGRQYGYPFLLSNPSTRRHTIAAEVFRYLGLLAMVLSIGCFGRGLFEAKVAFHSIATSKAAINSSLQQQLHVHLPVPITPP
jgi:hypothetical protein